MQHQFAIYCLCTVHIYHHNSSARRHHHHHCHHEGIHLIINPLVITYNIREGPIKIVLVKSPNHEMTFRLILAVFPCLGDGPQVGGGLRR